MRTIELTRGKFTLVSDKDYTFLMQRKWYALFCRSGKHFYAARMTCHPNRKIVLMHRVILERMGFKNFKDTDHKDRNSLNNQRRNLRPATRTQNQCNRMLTKRSTCGYKGVNWHKMSGKWQAMIGFNGKSEYLGLYIDPVSAARAYNKRARELHGKFVEVNHGV